MELVILSRCLWTITALLVLQNSPCCTGSCFPVHCGDVAKHGGDWEKCLQNNQFVCKPDEICVIDYHNKDVHFHCHKNDSHHQEVCQSYPSLNSQRCSLYLSLSQVGDHKDHHCYHCCHDKACIFKLIEESKTHPTTPTTTTTSTTATAAATATTATTAPTATTFPTATPTLDQASVEYLLKQCPDLVPACTDHMCKDHLAPTICRRHCGFCDAKFFVLNTTQVPTKHPSHATATPPTASTKTPIKSTTITATVATTTMKLQPTTAKTTSSTASMTPGTTTPLDPCHDKYNDCATIPFVCSSMYADAICLKHCNLCNQTTTTTTATTTHSTVATPGTLMSISCLDQLTVATCLSKADTCNDTVTRLLCPATCELCGI